MVSTEGFTMPSGINSYDEDKNRGHQDIKGNLGGTITTDNKKLLNVLQTTPIMMTSVVNDGKIDGGYQPGNMIPVDLQFKDDTDPHNIVDISSVNTQKNQGPTDDPIAFPDANKQINKLINDGYTFEKVVLVQKDGNESTLETTGSPTDLSKYPWGTYNLNTGTHFIAYLKHHADDTKTDTVNETIHYVDEDGNMIHPDDTDKIDFSGSRKWNSTADYNWDKQNQTFEAVDIPTIPGYELDKAVLDDKDGNPTSTSELSKDKKQVVAIPNINHDSKDVTITVVFKQVHEGPGTPQPQQPSTPPTEPKPTTPPAPSTKPVQPTTPKTPKVPTEPAKPVVSKKHKKHTLTILRSTTTITTKLKAQI